MQQDTCSAPTVLIGLHLYKLLIKRGIKELKFKKKETKWDYNEKMEKKEHSAVRYVDTDN